MNGEFKLSHEPGQYPRLNAPRQFWNGDRMETSISSDDIRYLIDELELIEISES